MIDVLLVYPPYSWPFMSPPLGLAYIAAVLHDAGYTVKILDMTPMRITMEQLEGEIRKIKPKVLGISSMTIQAKKAIQIAEIAKKANDSIKVIVGGPHPTALPEEMLASRSVDFVCMGEGEFTVTELVESLLHENGDISAIPGLVSRGSRGEMVRTEPRPLIHDLDKLPFPAWDLLPIKEYRVSNIGLRSDRFTFTLLSSRGCPYQCIFCNSHGVMGRKFRMRSAENLFAEIEMLYHEYGMRQMDFVDDTVTLNSERVDTLCDLLINSKMDLTWTCNSTVRIADLNMLQKMRKAGCIRIDFGVESGDPKVLKRIRKGITINQVIRAHRLAKEAGMKTASFFIIGLPDQDIKSVKMSLALAELIETDYPAFSVAIPYPGTELYEEAKRNQWLLTTDWERYITASDRSDIEPVMVTDKMGQDELRQALAYTSAYLARLWARKEYGRLYYLDPRLYFENLRSSRDGLSLRILVQKMRNFLRLLKTEVEAQLGLV